MKKHLFVFISISFLVLSCDKSVDKGEFDRKIMLTNIASAVIKPAINNMAAALSNLDAAAIGFAQDPDAPKLDILKTEFVTSYSAFQGCKMFDFGPFKKYGVKSAMNTYPTDSAKIEDNITTGSYTLGSVTNVDAIGFPALDYLLYCNDASLLTLFTTAPNAGNRQTYLINITGKLKSEFDLVLSNWNTYEDIFINSDGNDATSSTSLLFNEFVKDIELLKNAKVGIPAGQQTGGQTLPTYVEGYYSGMSISLAKDNILGLKLVFQGNGGSGFDDYINDVEDEDIATSLADNILSQFDLCSQKFDLIPFALKDAVDLDPLTVSDALLEIKKLITYCKTDMASTLGLLISFQDNDGD